MINSIEAMNKRKQIDGRQKQAADRLRSADSVGGTTSTGCAAMARLGAANAAVARIGGDWR